MRTSVGFKARYGSFEQAKSLCESLGATFASSEEQQDTCFATTARRLKLRETSGAPIATLVLYDRLDTPLPRETSFTVLPVSRQCVEVVDVFVHAAGSRASITKRRDIYRLGRVVINVDDVSELGVYLGVEIEAPDSGDVSAAFDRAEQLIHALRLSPSDLVAWSYSELLAMRRAAEQWRSVLAGKKGIFLLDGASCTGKTTLATRVTQREELHAELIPRYSTRAPRGGVSSEPEYVFVSLAEFRAMAMAGAFIEYRDFKFGMSYGLPWKETIAPVTHGARAVGIVDLGNVRHVKSLLPEAVTILVTASEATLRQRLIARGHNAEPEIEERLDNARKVRYYTDFYDYIIENGEGMLNAAEAEIAAIIERHSA